MKQTNLTLFNLDNLINNLNSILEDSDEAIELGNYEAKKVVTPFFYRIMDTSIEFKGRFPLIQTKYRPDLLSIFGLESEILLGHIDVERGYINSNDCDPGTYETIQLQTKHPLTLKNEMIIPKIRINFYQEHDTWQVTNYERKDQINYANLFYLKTDLSRILPSDWFLNK